jgi:hypothetical protein
MERGERERREEERIGEGRGRGEERRGYVLFFSAGGSLVDRDSEGRSADFQKTFLHFFVVHFEEGRERWRGGRGEAVEVASVRGNKEVVYTIDTI